MYRNRKISITIPVFNEELFIKDVISNLPEFIDHIIIVDDASSDNSWKKINELKDNRIIKLQHEYNQGIGKSTITGHQKAIELGAEFLVRIDGDHQMDSKHLIPLLKPLFDENIHFAKGNRLRKKAMRESMPKFRLIGNIILSKMTQITTGYKHVSDPQNGYTAIKSDVFELLNKDKLKPNYLYENSILFELSQIGSNIKEVDMQSKYGNEKSSIKYHKFIFSMISYSFNCLMRKSWNFIRRDIMRREVFYKDSNILL